jgi:hypothetical protein
MKSFFSRRTAALTLALVLGACGGKATFQVAGIIEGLKYPGLVLVNNGGSDLVIAETATKFAFPNSIEYGSTYNVTVKTPPLHQTCEPVNNADTAGRLASINVGIFCSMLPHSIGGTITGLTADGLVLTNGTTGGTNTSPKASTAFTFGVQIPFGTSYGVTILTQPTGQTCTVKNGVGVMGDANVTNIAVECV